MEPQRQAALGLVPANLAELYRLVPLSYDGEVLRIAAECAVAENDVWQFLGVTRVDVELWPAERVAAALAESYPAPPSPPPAPAPRFAAAREVFDGVLAVGSAVVCHMVGRLVRGRCPLATAEGYRCPCGRHVVVGFHPSGRVFTVHCPSFRHAFVHFECGRPPAWWRERVHYDWVCGGPPLRDV